MAIFNITKESEARKILFECLKNGGAEVVECTNEKEIWITIKGKQVAISADNRWDGEHERSELNVFISDADIADQS